MREPNPKSEDIEVQTAEYQVMAPVQQGNLQMFLITGTEEIRNKQYITLSEALIDKKVIVKETGSVNELSIDNNSDDYVFIHSGDIVKGGKQDRTISMDVIIPPKTKNIPLQSFCVEHNRWRKRGQEDVHSFSYNTKMLSSKELKLAAKYNKSQSEVWDNVAKQQKDLDREVSEKNGYNTTVRDSRSASSLQLTLENEELEKAKTDKEEAFKNVLASNPQAIGFAYAINGEVYSIDIYNNRQLFEDMWDKLREAAITESIAKDIDQHHKLATIEDVKQLMAQGPSTAKVDNMNLNQDTRLKTVENGNDKLLFETEDVKQNNWIHRNYMKNEVSKR